jgi:hypothetical protein
MDERFDFGGGGLGAVRGTMVEERLDSRIRVQREEGPEQIGLVEGKRQCWGCREVGGPFASGLTVPSFRCLRKSC